MIDRIAPYTDKVYVPITIEIEQVKGADTPLDTKDDEVHDTEKAILCAIEAIRILIEEQA